MFACLGAAIATGGGYCNSGTEGAVDCCKRATLRGGPFGAETFAADLDVRDRKLLENRRKAKPHEEDESQCTK